MHEICNESASQSDSYDLRLPSEDLTKKSVQKIVEDFRVSLSKALESIGECSNAEKHVNELIHRANFRFSDLQTWVNMCRKELNKCH